MNDVLALQIKNPGNRMCVDTMGHASGENAGVTACHEMGGNQVRFVIALSADRRGIAGMELDGQIRTAIG